LLIELFGQLQFVFVVVVEAPTLVFLLQAGRKEGLPHFMNQRGGLPYRVFYISGSPNNPTCPSLKNSSRSLLLVFIFRIADLSRAMLRSLSQKMLRSIAGSHLLMFFLDFGKQVELGLRSYILAIQEGINPSIARNIK
jgi:hypothetical protein